MKNISSLKNLTANGAGRPGEAVEVMRTTSPHLELARWTRKQRKSTQRQEEDLQDNTARTKPRQYSLNAIEQ